MPSKLRGFAIYHAALDRYLQDPGRDWDTFFSPAGLADFNAGTAPLTDDADRQLIYSGILEWIRRVHGNAGLASFSRRGGSSTHHANGWLDLGDLPNRTAEQAQQPFSRSPDRGSRGRRGGLFRPLEDAGQL